MASGDTSERLGQGDASRSDSHRYLFPKEKIFVNAVDDLEMIAVSKRAMSLLPQKQALRIELNHLNRRQSHGQRFIVFRWKTTHIIPMS